MPRLRLPLLIAVSLLLFVPVSAQDGGTPKTLVIGFDGMDHALAAKFMDEGLMPNFSRLAEQGHFGRLETSNPAQSPVSWAVFNTGQNPGKTGVGGFVSRYFGRKDGVRSGPPRPQPMLGFVQKMPADLQFMGVSFGSSSSFVAALAGGAAVLAFLILKVLLGAKAGVALLLTVICGGGAGYYALSYAGDMPADGQLPYEINPMQGTNFWSYLDDVGIRMTGVQVASTFPPDEEGPNTRILSGLGVKDISGSPGSWFIYSDDPWSWTGELSGGGDLKKVYFDLESAAGPETKAEAELVGPKDWIAEARLQNDVDVLADRIPTTAEGEPIAGSAPALEDELRDARTALNKFKKDRSVKVPFEMIVDREAGTLDISVQGQSVTLEEGGWSDFIPVTFRFNAKYAAHGVARFHLIRCDEEEVRIFVPPINIDPANPPEWMPISSPPEFAGEIEEAIGSSYETLGWACMTNPLKATSDSHFNAQSFLDDIVDTMNRRELILDWALDQSGDWDVYYQVFSTVDRICHMLMREYDPEHPEYDAAYADTSVTAWGRQFRLGDSVPEIYKEADRVVGTVLDAIASGDLGENALLMVVADHGFNSFRRGVNLNNLLHELGYLKTKDDKPLAEFKGMARDMLNYVDWERTQAYSLGLGKVFINLDGREPSGIVSEAEYDDLVQRIRNDLLEVTDEEQGGNAVFTSVKRREALFSGPWWKEGEAVYRTRGIELDPRPYDGFADLFVGFAPTYRVSWGNTMGGADSAAIMNNTNHWSGGHVSVDPQHVAGIFYCNRALTGDDKTAGLIDIGPTMLARYGLDPAETDMDGKVIPIENIER